MATGRLLNYTTTVQVSKTSQEIVGMLAAHGVTRIQAMYNDGQITGLLFGIQVDGRELAFQLPVNAEAVYLKLQEDYDRGRIAARYAGREHAFRVAWRILKDWIEAQIALIETHMVRTEEVFLPYLLNEDGDRTLYQIMSNSWKQLEAPKGEYEVTQM